MRLFLSSQDIKTIFIGLLEEKHFLKKAQIETSPEGFLFELDRTLSAWKVDFSKINSVMVVSGPGSFTSSRISVTIANAIGFMYQILVIAIENPLRLSQEQLIETIDLSVQGQESVQPVYDRAPHIT